MFSANALYINLERFNEWIVIHTDRRTIHVISYSCFSALCMSLRRHFDIAVHSTFSLKGFGAIPFDISDLCLSFTGRFCAFIYA